MDEKQIHGAIFTVVLGLIVAYLSYRFWGKNDSSGIASSNVLPSSRNVKARAAGPAIRMYDPTQNQPVWTAPLGYHVEQASDGTWWSVPNRAPQQLRQGASAVVN